LQLIQQHYGYDKYGGGCHIIPNHALVILALLYGSDSFQHALTIVNTSGWDTDCNSANVGCLMGIRLGLAGMNAGPDFSWTGCGSDIYPPADGAGTVTDALHEAIEVAPDRTRTGTRTKAVCQRMVLAFISTCPEQCKGSSLKDSVTSRATSKPGEREWA